MERRKVHEQLRRDESLRLWQFDHYEWMQKSTYSNVKCTKASSNLSAVLSALLICAFVLHIKIINIFNISFYFLFSFDYFWMNRLELQQVVDQLMNRRWICNYFDNRLIVIFKQKFGYISLHCSKFTCWHFELL